MKRKLITLTFLFLILIASTSGAAELDLSFDDAAYAQIYRILGKSQGLNVLVAPEVKGTGSFNLKGVSFEKALDLISSQGGFSYRLEDNTLFVSLKTNDKSVRYIPLAKESLEDVKDALDFLMPALDVYIPTGGGVAVLEGSPADLARAEELIKVLEDSQKADEKQQTLLEVFQVLSGEMNLNLIAEPSLGEINLYLDIKQGDPKELIAEIQTLIPLKVEITDNSLVVGSLKETPSEERIKVYRLNYAEPATTQSALEALLATEKIKVDEERKSVIVKGTDSELAQVDLFLLDFDTPPPQVVLEVWVQEISSEALRDLGIELKGTPSFSGGEAPVFLELKWEPWELILALKTLEEQGDAKLLANPKIATLSGQEASIFVGDRVPVVLRDEENSQTIQHLESGINLKVTPRISDDDYITILVQPEVSTFVWRPDTQYPQIRTREAETNVRVKDGQPIVLGGLIQEQENETISKIPFLSELPVLGRLFQWKETKRSQTEMTIFLIPKIVKGDEDFLEQSFFTPTR